MPVNAPIFKAPVENTEYRKLHGEKGEGGDNTRQMQAYSLRTHRSTRYTLSTRYIYICMYVCTTFVLASNRISPLQLSFRERFDVVNRGTRGRARRNKNGNKKEETSEEGVNRKGRGKSHG